MSMQLAQGPGVETHHTKVIFLDSPAICTTQRALKHPSTEAAPQTN